MEPILWILVDEEGLVVLSGGRQYGDTEYFASVVFLGYLSLKRALENELHASPREVILPTDQYLIMILPLGNHLLIVAYPEDTALGLARMGLKKLRTEVIQKVKAVQKHSVTTAQASPSSPPQKPPTQELTPKDMPKILSFIQHHAPDPAFLLKRVALRSGVPEQRIMDGNLSDEEFHRVLRHMENILGVNLQESLNEENA